MESKRPLVGSVACAVSVCVECVRPPVAVGCAAVSLSLRAARAGGDLYHLALSLSLSQTNQLSRPLY